MYGSKMRKLALKTLELIFEVWEVPKTAPNWIFLHRTFSGRKSRFSFFAFFIFVSKPKLETKSMRPEMRFERQKCEIKCSTEINRNMWTILGKTFIELNSMNAHFLIFQQWFVFIIYHKIVHQILKIEHNYCFGCQLLNMGGIT